MYKKLFISIMVSLAFSQVIKAQENEPLRNPKLGIGIAALFGETKSGVGYFLNFQSPIVKDLNWVVTVGKTNLLSMLKVNPRRKYDDFFAKVGGKYFLNRQLYFSGDVGAAFDQIHSKNTRFAWSTGIGLEIKVFGKSAIDISGNYEAYQSANSLKFFSLKAAINFGL